MQQKIVVISYNIGNVAEEFPSPVEVWHTVYSHAPDILLLQEVVTEENARQIAEFMEEEYGCEVYYRFTEKIGNGVAIIAIFPLKDFGIIPGSDVYGGASAIADVKGKRVLLASIHLPYIPKDRDARGNVDLNAGSLIKTLTKEFFLETPRSKLMESLHDWIQDQTKNAAVVAGDFNTVPFSRVQTVMQNGFSDSLSGKRDYLMTSYKKISINIGTRADFIFHSPQLYTAESFIINSTAGDHYPVLAELYWR